MQRSPLHTALDLLTVTRAKRLSFSGMVVWSTSMRSAYCYELSKLSIVRSPSYPVWLSLSHYNLLEASDSRQCLKVAQLSSSRRHISRVSRNMSAIYLGGISAIYRWV